MQDAAGAARPPDPGHAAETTDDVVVLGDPARVSAAQRLADSPRTPSLDRLVTLAARLLGASSAQVSLLTREQVVPAGTGGAAEGVGLASPLADSLCTVTMASGAPLVVDDAPGDPRVAELPPVATGAVGAYLGAPLWDAQGHAVGALCVFDEGRRAWSPDDVTLLGELASVASAELELSALTGDYDTVRVRLDLAMDAAGIGSWDLDLTSGRLTWDDRLLELFGYEAGEFDGTLAAFFARVHPDDVARVTHEIEAAVDTLCDLDVQYRVVLPDGGTRWLAARGRCVLGADGSGLRLLGAAEDRTQERDAATRVGRVLETMPAAFFSVDRQWRFTYVNSRAEELLGSPRDVLVGGELWELFPGSLDSTFEAEYRAAATTGHPVEFEAYYPPPLDRWYTVRAWPDPGGLSVYFHDTTERRLALDEAQRARQASEGAASRIELLGRVSTELAAETEPHRALERLARLVVPALADWCLVDTLDEEGQVRDAAAWHADPDLRAVADAYARAEHTLPLSDVAFAASAVRTGEAVVLEPPAEQRMSAGVGPGPVRDLLARLAPQHGLVLPLTARGRTLGLLHLFSGAERGPLSPLDLATAAEVASRAGLSLDNKRLYLQQRTLAETLQRSMLTAPPAPDHLQLVVRYVPAAEEAQVGGDWYDAFMQADGATVVAIGDVTGHDVASAASMGQLRGLLRGIAYTTGNPPGDVLARLDQAISGLQLDTTATAVVLRIEQDADLLERGRRRLRWSNAGHPPPVLLRNDGTVTVLEGERSDLLLGVVPGAGRREWSVEVEWDTTVLLYTDGLIERRNESLSDGMARLRRILTELGSEPTLDELCDALLARMLPGEPQDDVALVAVRLNRQDRPRPSEAGPHDVPPGVPDDAAG